MTRIPRFLCALPFLLATGLLADAPAPVHVPFMEGKPFSEVLARAQREKKPVLLDVYASWCNPCKFMDRTTFSDVNVVAWVNAHAIPARVDAEKGEGRKVAARYAVSSFPTILFLEPNGNEIDRIMGAQPAGAFEKYGDTILSGKGPLAGAIAELKQHFEMQTALQLVSALGDRNDLVRLRPIALRVMQEDPDLAEPGTLGALAILAMLEDRAGSVTPETADLVETYLPKIGADPRRGLLSVILAHELVRRKDWAGLRAHVAKSAAAIPRDGYLSDLYAALGEGERKAGALAASDDAYRKSLAILEEQKLAPGVIVARRLELAETLVAEKKNPEATALLAKALEAFPSDPGVLARVASLQLRSGQKQEALKNARQAVESSSGNDAGAQAALAHALAATGDAKGAAAAWSRARALEPENPEYGKPLAKS